MKPAKLGLLSALMASVCCLGPVLLVLLGLGSLGFGAILGRYHWWFIAAAMAILAFAWRSYLKEAGRCRTGHCEMPQGKTTKTVLILASTVVAVFAGLNLSTYASQYRSSSALGIPTSSRRLASVTIPVEGMTCFTCELTVESSLKRLPGVQDADAKVTEQAAYVRYDPARVSLDTLIAAINKTGYKARRPSPSSQGG